MEEWFEVGEGMKFTFFRSVSLVLAVAASVSMTSHANGLQQISKCKLRFRSGSEACYAPRDALAAQARFGGAPFNPSAVVKKASRLALTQVIVSGVGTSKHVQIHYLYGQMPNGQKAIPGPSPTEPRFMVVQEVKGQVVPLTPTLHRAIIASILRLPWTFTGYSRSANRSLVIVSNVARKTIKTVGQALLALLRGRGK